jgi:Na+/proline symporter
MVKMQPQRGERPVGIGTSIFLIALGAILTFAVEVDISGLELSSVGVILMIAGALGLIISIFLMSQASRRGVATERPVTRERDVY